MGIASQSVATATCFEMLLTRGDGPKQTCLQLLRQLCVSGTELQSTWPSSGTAAVLQRPLKVEPSTWLQLEMGIFQNCRVLLEPGPSLLEEKGPIPLPDTELGRRVGAGAGAPWMWWPLG